MVVMNSRSSVEKKTSNSEAYDDTPKSASTSTSAAPTLPNSESDLIDLSYPVFASVWETNSTLIVGGGGGEGRNGVKNKISIIKVKADNKGLFVKSEILLAADEDNPTSLDVSGSGKIYAGVNRNSKAIVGGNNTHLRVFSSKNIGGKEKKEDVDNLSFKVFTSNDINEYQKCTKVSDSGELLAISSSLNPGSIYVFKIDLLSVNGGAIYKKTLGVGEINDLDFSPNSDKLAYINDSKLYVIDSLSGDECIVVDLPRKDSKFSKLRFVDENLIVVSANINQKKGVLLYKFNPKTGARISTKQLSSKIKAVSTMDAGTKYVILGTSDCSIAIVSTNSLVLLKKLEKVHEIAITSVSLNPSQNRIASSSVSGTVRVLELPLDGIFNGGIKSIIYAFWSVLLIGTLAIILQVLIKRQVFDDLIGFAKDHEVKGLLRRGDGSSSTSSIESVIPSIITDNSYISGTATTIASTPTNVEVGEILVDNIISVESVIDSPKEDL